LFPFGFGVVFVSVLLFGGRWDEEREEKRERGKEREGRTMARRRLSRVPWWYECSPWLKGLFGVKAREESVLVL
jgi:hypothetical protein